MYVKNKRQYIAGDGEIKVSRATWIDNISDITCFRLFVESTELSEITVDREVIRIWATQFLKKVKQF